MTFKPHTTLVVSAVLAIASIISPLLANSDSSFVKTNRFGIHWGWSHWSQPSVGELNKVNGNYFAKRTPDLGLYFERTFMPNFYYAIGLNYMQLNTALDLQFNRNDFYPWFNSVENGPYSPMNILTSFNNQGLGLSFTLGHEWLNSPSFLIKSAAGINLMHFTGGQNTWVTYTELQTISGFQYPIAILDISQPSLNGGIGEIFERRLFIPALRLNGEVVYKLKRFHIGLGYNVNIGFRKVIWPEE